MDIISVEFDSHALQVRAIEIILRIRAGSRRIYGGWITFVWEDVLVPSESDEPLLPAFQSRNSL